MNIQFTKNTYKDNLNLPLNYKDMLDRLLERNISGIPVDIKQIQGEQDTYRIRIGRYRLLFIKINPDILMVKIDNRNDIYH